MNIGSKIKFIDITGSKQQYQAVTTDGYIIDIWCLSETAYDGNEWRWFLQDHGYALAFGIESTLFHAKKVSLRALRTVRRRYVG